jgi:hypothetical protein
MSKTFDFEEGCIKFSKTCKETLFIIIFLSLSFFYSISLFLFFSHSFPHKIIFKENKELDKEFVGVYIKKRVDKVKIYIFSVTILPTSIGYALDIKTI